MSQSDGGGSFGGVYSVFCGGSNRRMVHSRRLFPIPPNSYASGWCSNLRYLVSFVLKNLGEHSARVQPALRPWPAAGISIRTPNWKLENARSSPAPVDSGESATVYRKSGSLARSSEAWIDRLPLRFSGELILYGL